MKKSIIIALFFTILNTNQINAHADFESFDTTAVGSLPSGWLAGVTGNGPPIWEVQTNTSAPSSPNVLKQSGQGTYPWCVKENTSLSNGFAQVQFMPLSGEEDQAAGLIWRWKDGNNYYVARANALENNVSLYYTKNGERIKIMYVKAPVSAKVWHTLRVEFVGSQIKVFLDGKKYIDLQDIHIPGVGAIGLWTKADSVTAFDNFSFGAE